MSFAEITFVGSLIESLVIILTLVVLVYQISRTRRENSRENVRTLIRHNNEIFLSLAEDSELMDIHVRGQRDFENLSDVELMRWGVWLFTWITQTEQGYVDRRQKDFSGLELDAYVEGVALVLRSKGGRFMWPRLKANFDPSFCDAVERQIAMSNTTQVEMVTDPAWQPSPATQAP